MIELLLSSFAIFLIIWAWYDILGSNRTAEFKTIWVLVTLIPVVGPVIYFSLKK
jgi:hypothetical protein